eukprot:gene4649-biopygen5492
MLVGYLLGDVGEQLHALRVQCAVPVDLPPDRRGGCSEGGGSSPAGLVVDTWKNSIRLRARIVSTQAHAHFCGGCPLPVLSKQPPPLPAPLASFEMHMTASLLHRPGHWQGWCFPADGSIRSPREYGNGAQRNTCYQHSGTARRISQRTQMLEHGTLKLGICNFVGDVRMANTLTAGKLSAAWLRWGTQLSPVRPASVQPQLAHSERRANNKSIGAGKCNHVLWGRGPTIPGTVRLMGMFFKHIDAWHRNTIRCKLFASKEIVLDCSAFEVGITESLTEQSGKCSHHSS